MNPASSQESWAQGRFLTSPRSGGLSYPLQVPEVNARFRAKVHMRERFWRQHLCLLAREFKPGASPMASGKRLSPALNATRKWKKWAAGLSSRVERVAGVSMTGQQYRDWCLNKLSPMGRRHLAAFAASCTERQFGTYEFVARSDNRLDPVFVRGALDRAWGWIAGTDSLNHNFRELAERAVELAPDLETDPSPYAGFVSNVIISLYHTLLLCETGSAGDALAAGDAAINTVDEYVVTTTPHPTVLDREDLRALNQAVDESPLMRRELAKQEADLRYLEQQENIGVSQCDHLRRTWSNGSRSNIDLG